MARISIDIPDNILTRVVNGFCSNYGYQDTIDGIPNPETKQQFLKRKIIEFVKEAARNTEMNAAANAASITAKNAADSELAIT